MAAGPKSTGDFCFFRNVPRRESKAKKLQRKAVCGMLHVYDDRWLIIAFFCLTTIRTYFPISSRSPQQDYRDHRDKIFSKFVSMIEELIEARAGSLKLTDWDTPGGRAGSWAGAAGAESSGGGSGAEGGGAAAGGDPCQFTADVRKAVTAMHNILQQQLPPEQLQVCVLGSCMCVCACLGVGEC